MHDDNLKNYQSTLGLHLLYITGLAQLEQIKHLTPLRGLCLAQPDFLDVLR